MFAERVKVYNYGRYVTSHHVEKKFVVFTELCKWQYAANDHIFGKLDPISFHCHKLLVPGLINVVISVFDVRTGLVQ